MRVFARVDKGIVVELFPPVPTPPELLQILPEDGDIRPMFGYAFDAWQEITGLYPQPQENWVVVGGLFSAPLPNRPTAADSLLNNTALRDSLYDTASRRINLLQDAVDDLQADTSQVQLLSQLKKYRAVLGRLDLTTDDLTWPAAPA